MFARTPFFRVVLFSVLAAGIGCAVWLFAAEGRAGESSRPGFDAASEQPVPPRRNEATAAQPRSIYPGAVQSPARGVNQSAEIHAGEPARRGRAAGKPQAAPAKLPRELAMRPLPAYRIEPPDVVQIEMLKLIPLPPYRAGIFDVLQIRAANTLVDRPIDNQYLIDAEGRIDLGPVYGKVKAVGLTVDQVEQAIGKKLSEMLKSPQVFGDVGAGVGLPARQRPVPRRPRRHDQPAELWDRATGGQDGGGGPAGLAKPPQAVPPVARALRRGGQLQ